MDFSKIKEKAKLLKDKAKTWIWNLINSSAEKLQESEFVLKNKENLELFITKSKNKVNEDQTTTKRRIIVIFARLDTDFYKKALYRIPILYTKAWTQNVEIKMCSLPNEDLENYKIINLPSLVVFEDEKVYKIIEWEEKIKKVVNWFTLDINKLVESIN